MKRILLVTATYLPVLGGTQRQCWLLARELHRRDWEVTVLTRRERGAPATSVAEGVAVRRTPAFGRSHWQSFVWTLTATAWLRRYRRRFNVLQCYQLLSPAHVGILGRFAGQAVVVRPACSGPYGDVAEARRLPLTGMRRRLLRRADVFVTLTEAIKAELAEFGLGMIPCRHIPNGVDLAAFTPAGDDERRALRARLGLPEDRVLCAFVGRLTPQKDPGILLEAWSVGRLSQAHLVLVGDGPLRKDLEGRVACGPLAGQVIFAGATADVSQYLRAADLLALPSRAEGMSNALLEAMACGLPVVATDLPGNREVLDGERVTGILVPAGDPVALSEALGALVASSALRREVGGAARQRTLERFGIDRVGAQYLSLYEELSG